MFQIALVVFNLLLFVGLGAFALREATRAPSKSIRILWSLTALPVAAVVLGGIQRLAIQGVRVGWLPVTTFHVVIGPWQIVQSIAVAGLGVFTFYRMRVLESRLFNVEAVVGDLVDRAGSVDLARLGLTPRELDVLNVIGLSNEVDDRTLAEKLSISPDTAHSHVTSLLRKTKLRDRRDLKVVAFLHRSTGQG